MRIQYKSPQLYEFFISFLYSKKLLKQFTKEVDKNRTVFDVAAGYGRMSRFIDSSNSYYGIDLNKKFVEYGKKHGINLEIKNIFDSAAYKKSDVFIVVDIVHHLSTENLKKLFDLIFNHANQKVIVIEPAFVNFSVSYGLLGRLIDWFFGKIDDDGLNKITHWFSGDEYKNLFKSRFGSKYGSNFSVSYNRYGAHYLAVFIRK